MQTTPKIRAMYLAGKPFVGEQSLDVFDKYTQERIARVSAADAPAIDEAISSAWNARSVMAAVPPPDRYTILMHCANRLLEQESLFAQTLVEEAGKPITYAKLEVQRASDTFRRAAEESLRIGGEVIPLEVSPRTVGYRGMTKRVPVGVCSLITPFNFPLNLVAHKVAPAIAAGCPWILKPASLTPLSALLLGDVLAETNLPSQAYSILPASREAASTLTTDERISMLSFTGSDAVGWALKRASGKKKVCLELGGNAACLIDDTYPYRDAIPKIVAAAFGQAGQSCISVQRLFLHESIYDQAVALLVDQSQKLVCGNPRNSETVVGPLIDAKEADRTLDWLESARRAGAEVLLEPNRSGNVVSPIILTRVSHDQPVVCQEAFAPILVVESYRDFAAALGRINDSRYGLQAGIFTNHLERALMAWDRLEVGGVLIGEVPSWRVDHMPYGGVKDSGLGREGVRFAIEEMTEPRLLVLRG